ncbi:MAG: sulfate adenylyltransferase, partial [Candidatus Rokubacteria bacterium]|nr:sulfate adenylyltransferase [Candidatus Rokubacteria bacterium]
MAPHGGTLVDRILVSEAREEAIARARDLPKVVLNARAMSDLDLLAVGALSPLEGFMCRADYR